MELVVVTDITCPHCGEVFPLQVDTSEPEQSVIEDCTVCCRPINLGVQCRPGSIIEIVVARG